MCHTDGMSANELEIVGNKPGCTVASAKTTNQAMRSHVQAKTVISTTPMFATCIELPTKALQSLQEKAVGNMTVGTPATSVIRCEVERSGEPGVRGKR